MDPTAVWRQNKCHKKKFGKIGKAKGDEPKLNIFALAMVLMAISNVIIAFSNAIGFNE